MSDIKLKWLADNFSTEPCVIFDIGCADVTGDAATFSQLLNSRVYAFECSHSWKEHNELYAKQLGIEYFHVAIADHNDGVVFHPSDKNQEQEWPWSGSIYKPTEYLSSTGLTWKETYTVPSITLNDFCATHNVVPDFIHIDAQGAEYSIFKDMKICPKVIWAEISAFEIYETETSYQEFNDMMLSYGYNQEYSDNHDALYVLDSLNFTSYIDSN
jgi:FkbM family methyltransferase